MSESDAIDMRLCGQECFNTRLLSNELTNALKKMGTFREILTTSYKLD